MEEKARTRYDESARRSSTPLLLRSSSFYMRTLIRELMFPLIAVVAAFLFGGVIVWIVGDSPLLVYELFFTSAFGTLDGIGYTLFYATPLIFTGLAVAVAFKCGLLNIGAEGARSSCVCDGLGGDGARWRRDRYYAASGGLLMGGVWAASGVRKAKLGATKSSHDHDELHRDRSGQLSHAIPLPKGWRSDPRDVPDRRES